MAFGVVTFFLRKQGNGKKNRPVALDPQKKIPFKLVDKKVSAYKLPERGIRTRFFYYFLGILCQGEVSAETGGSLSLGLKYMNVVMNHYMVSVSISIYVVFALC